MIPVLFQIGPITVYSFGLMMGISFIVANYLFTRELRRKGIPEAMAGTITLIALIAGVVGAKLFSLLENFKQVLDDPMGEIFSASGLTFYGGLILATLSILYYVRRKKVPFLRVADAAAPALIIAYGIGRIGCQLSGDGDYGIPSKLPWAMAYPKGTVPTTGKIPTGNGGFQLTQLGEKFKAMYPGDDVPLQVPVHPTPVYETLATIAIFLLLWSLRKQPKAAGWLFGIYLICAGIERFLVEFIRLNPLYGGLSQAQWISIGLMGLGAYFVRRAAALPDEPPPPARREPAKRAARAAR